MTAVDVPDIDLTPARTLKAAPHAVSVVIPAHNEAATVRTVVAEAFRSLERLGVDGEVIVSASGCTDDTAEVAAAAGAEVVLAAVGKGAALKAGAAHASGGVICMVDADVEYYGDRPLVELLTEPILHGIADVTISDLYWRPLYPQMWLHGFFLPLCGYLYPELPASVGSTPWSGQRAALRTLWPSELPDGFTVDLALLLHWRRTAIRMRPVLADDWVNPMRPKPELLRQEFDLLLDSATSDGRATATDRDGLTTWFEETERQMATYEHGADEPVEFERQLLHDRLGRLRTHVRRVRADHIR